MPAIFLGCSHAEYAHPAKSINHATRYIRFPVNFRRIEMLVQKLAKRGKSSVQFDLLHRRDARIGHYPIGNEVALEKTFSKTERLRACKKQFLGLLNFFLSLRVELIHSICLGKNRRRIVAMRARVSNRVRHVVFRTFRPLKKSARSDRPNFKTAVWIAAAPIKDLDCKV